MQQETGIITRIEEDKAYVAFSRSSMCEKCGACERASSKMIMQVKKPRGATIGDEVRVQMETGRLLLAAFIAYGIPLILLFCGLFLGYNLFTWLSLPGAPDLWAALCGIVLAALAFFAIRLTEKGRSKRGFYQPRVIHDRGE